ncbi:uncharacterized protein LOC111863645, partial [Cryptotermes secundus]|uniref:uncharacterized protein LOC111863645 n=1 Tax=Cryptotermes secundus TaxID=105785 RepID=UPI000CD7C6B4
MEDSDNDTTDKDTDGTDKSFSDSLEAFQMNNEDLSAEVRRRRRADEQSNGADSAEEQSGEGLPETDELERKMEELEANVRRLQDEEQLLKRMLSSAVTRSQLENRLSFYKFSGLYVSKFTDSKLCVDLTPTLHGKRSGCFSYYVQFRILSDD